MPMASVMAVAEPKWVPLGGRFLWVMLLSMALGSLLALLLPLAAVEEQCAALLKGLSLLRSRWDRAPLAPLAGRRCASPSTELSVPARDAALLAVKATASPGKRAAGCLPSTLGLMLWFIFGLWRILSVTTYAVYTF